MAAAGKPSKGTKNARARYIKIDGTKELRKALRQLEDKTAKKALGQELKAEFAAATAAVVRDGKSELASSVRTSASRRTGALGDSIRAKGALRGGTVLAGGTKRVPYAGPIHYGWPTRPNKSKGWRGGPIGRNPFLDRALYKNADEVVRLMQRGVDRLLDEVRKVAAGG